MSLDTDSLTTLLESLATGATTVAAAKQALSELTAVPSADGAVRIDVGRHDRCGYAEVVYAPGKSNQALLSAFETLIEARQDCLATRCTPEQSEFLLSHFPEAIYDELARTVRINNSSRQKGRVTVITAGTSDRPVAHEALETLRWMGVDADILMDVGVAGPQRFLSVKHQLADCDAVVVAAGMEGALPSVVAGWLSCPVVAVPTSVGYGAAFGGLTALLGMLNSCAANVAVVNIDAGFKAGYLAGMIAQRGKH